MGIKNRTPPSSGSTVHRELRRPKQLPSRTIGRCGSIANTADRPLDVAPAALQPLIRCDGVTDRRRCESALLLKVRDEIRTGNLAVDGAKNFGRFETSSCRARSGNSFATRSGRAPDSLPSARLVLVASDHDAFDLVERDRVRRPVVQLRRPRRRVPGNLLRVLERPPVRQIRRDARRTERVAARRRRQTRRRRTPLDHRQHHATRQRPAAQAARPVDALEQRRLRLIDPAGDQIRIHGGLGAVMGRHVVPLAALLLQPKPPPSPLQEQS